MVTESRLPACDLIKIIYVLFEINCSFFCKQQVIFIESVLPACDFMEINLW
jgi:hypothetical protein